LTDSGDWPRKPAGAMTFRLSRSASVSDHTLLASLVPAESCMPSGTPSSRMLVCSSGRRWAKAGLRSSGIVSRLVGAAVEVDLADAVLTSDAQLLPRRAARTLAITPMEARCI
jgi:hypothetical protein